MTTLIGALQQTMTTIQRKFLRPGEFYAAKRSVLAETLVGSCVTVCLYNVKGNFGAMNHFLRDRPHREPATDVGQYGTTATQHIIRQVLRIDSEPRHYKAFIFGGAAVIRGGHSQGDIGQANVAAALEVLRAAGIRVTRQEVGGARGRRVKFNTQTGEIDCRFAGDIPRKNRAAPAAT